MRHKFFLIAVPLVAMLGSCGLSPLDSGTEPQAAEETALEEESLLFKEKEDSDGGEVLFETNEARYSGGEGYTLWTAGNVNVSESFETLSATVSKESGKAEGGFGLVFCSQEVGGKPFMLALLINTRGMYAVGKVSDGTFSHIGGGWNSSVYIRRGYGIRNAVEVSYADAEKNFLLRINGQKITAFTVPEEISFKGSRWGYAVVVTPDEDFPDVPVRVTFENKK